MGVRNQQNTKIKSKNNILISKVLVLVIIILHHQQDNTEIVYAVSNRQLEFMIHVLVKGISNVWRKCDYIY